MGPTIHASAVLVGARAVLIRGPSGAGKSRLALSLLEAAQTGLLAFARLVADDRTYLEVAGGRLLARPPTELAGLLEVYGLGIRRFPYEPVAVVSLVVDLAATDAERLPAPASRSTTIDGIALPRLPIAADAEPLMVTLAALATAQASH